MKIQRHLMTFHYILRTVILLGISGYIVYLGETNTLQLYIGARIMPLVKGAAILAYTLGVVQAFIAYRNLKGDLQQCDCCSPQLSRSWWRNGLVYSLFSLPLLLGFLLPDTVLGGSFANTKGITLSSVFVDRNNPMAKPDTEPSASTKPTPRDSQGSPLINDDANTNNSPELPSHPTQEQLNQMFYTDDPFEADLAELGKRMYILPAIKVKDEIYMEVLSTIVVFIDHFIGREIEISGFVYRESDMQAHQLVIGRIAVQCCTADAAPYGVLTEFDGASEFPDDAWLTVRGTIGYTEYNGNKILKIDVTESSIMKAPDNPYIYPNFNFLDTSID